MPWRGSSRGSNPNSSGFSSVFFRIFDAVMTSGVAAQEELYGCPHGDLPPRRIARLHRGRWSRSQRRWGVLVPWCCLLSPHNPWNCHTGTCGSHWWLTPTLRAVGSDSLHIFASKKTRVVPVVLLSAS